MFMGIFPFITDAKLGSTYAFGSMSKLLIYHIRSLYKKKEPILTPVGHTQLPTFLYLFNLKAQMVS